MGYHQSTLREVLSEAPQKIDREVIRDLDHPYEENGCFSILFGNLAPQGSVVKKTGVDPAMYYHKGPAVVFESEEEVRDYMLNKKVKPGSVLVIRYEGPKGGPGMREMSIPAAMLVGMGLFVLLNYFGQRFFAFRADASKSDASPALEEKEPKKNP